MMLLMKGRTRRSSYVRLVLAITIVLCFVSILQFRGAKDVEHDVDQARVVEAPPQIAPHAAPPQTAPHAAPPQSAPHAAPPQTANTVRTELPLVAPPPWCEALKREPRPSGLNFRKCTGRGRYEAICPQDSKPRFFSQLHQDILLYEHHFKYLNRSGVYVDLAANEPVTMSNTYFFDTCLGWRGLCVEPNPNYQEPLRMLRTCTLEKACLGDKPQNVTFIIAEGLSGIDATNKNKDYRARVAAHSKVELTCKTTAEALEEAQITHIDYLSLDVEGHEPYVLRGINWNVTTIDVLSIELEANVAEAIEILVAQGFRKLDTTHIAASVGGLFPSIDSIYVHERVQWGKPV